MNTSKYREGRAAGPAAGAGGSACAKIAAQQSLPNHYQQQQRQPPAPAGPGTSIPTITVSTTTAATTTAETAAKATQEQQQQQQQPDRDATIRIMHDANIAAWKAQAEATGRLADAMVEVARSADALARIANDLVTSNYRLSDELAGLTGLIRGIVAATTARKESGVC